MLTYAPLHVRVTTPDIELVGATDTLLEQLQEVVRANKAAADPDPYDDPSSLYEDDPDRRVRRWLQGIWRGRGTVRPELWRLYFVVMLDGRPVGMQDLIGDEFDTYGSVTTFSWLSSDVRGRGVGREMRHAILHLAFDGLDAAEAISDAFVDNSGSNAVSRALGYQENGTTWATRRGKPGLIQRWRLTRTEWQHHRRHDIKLHGVSDCKAALELPSD